jgi:hypothetical protein
VQLLGQNGEGISNAHVIVTYDFNNGCIVPHSREHLKTTQLKTNKKGEIYINSTIELSTLSVLSKDFESTVSKKWYLNRKQ